MAVGFLDIEIVGSRRGVQQMLDHLDSALSPVGMTLFLRGRIAPYLRERAENRFKNEGDDATGKWRQLSQVSQEIREHYGFGAAHPINRRTGALEEYITGASADVRVAPGWSQLMYPEAPPSNTLTRKKMRVAQQGLDRPNTPARPVLALGEQDLAYTLTQLALHIQGWNRRLE